MQRSAPLPGRGQGPRPLVGDLCHSTAPLCSYLSALPLLQLATGLTCVFLGCNMLGAAANLAFFRRVKNPSAARWPWMTVPVSGLRVGCAVRPWHVALLPQLSAGEGAKGLTYGQAAVPNWVPWRPTR